jgi:CBS domain-containing protein
MDIGTACTREVYVVNPREPLLQAAVEMLRRNVGCIVVVEQRGKTTVPVGIITDRDLVRILPEHAQNLAGLAVVDAMTRDPLLAEEESVVDGMNASAQRPARDSQSPASVALFRR